MGFLGKVGFIQGLKGRVVQVLLEGFQQKVVQGLPPPALEEHLPPDLERNWAGVRVARFPCAIHSMESHTSWALQEIWRDPLLINSRTSKGSVQTDSSAVSFSFPSSQSMGAGVDL